MTLRIYKPRISPLDSLPKIIALSAPLRNPDGSISAHEIAKVYGVSLKEIAQWISSEQEQKPSAWDQGGLVYLERIVWLRIRMQDAEFRNWIRTPSKILENKSPMELLSAHKLKELSEFVEDALTGSPR